MLQEHPTVTDLPGWAAKSARHKDVICADACPGVANGDQSHSFHHYLITRSLYCGNHVKSVHAALEARLPTSNKESFWSSVRVIEKADFGSSLSALLGEAKLGEFRAASLLGQDLAAA